VPRAAFVLQLDMWLVAHEDMRHDARCRAAFDALRAGLQSYIRPVKRAARRSPAGAST
jgi:hypothetical protein